LADVRGGNVGAMNASKAIFKPVNIATSIAGGLIAGKLFTEIWQRLNPSDREPPDPQDLSRSTREAFVAAAVQGLIVGLVRAAFARAEAHGYRALTNEDPS
jgi:hypothetical protein